jgi:hypothetical protein
VETDERVGAKSARAADEKRNARKSRTTQLDGIALRTSLKRPRGVDASALVACCGPRAPAGARIATRREVERVHAVLRVSRRAHARAPAVLASRERAIAKREIRRGVASEGVEEESARETGCGVSRTVDSGRIREGTLAPPLDGVSKLVDARARGRVRAFLCGHFIFSAKKKTARLTKLAPSRSHFLNFAPGRPVSILSPTREQTSGRPEAHQPRVTSRISRDVPPRPRGRVSGSSHDEYARSRSWTRTRALRNDRA